MRITGCGDSIASQHSSVLAKQEKQKTEYHIDIPLPFRFYLHFLFNMFYRRLYLFIGFRHRLWHGRILSH